MRDFNEFVLEGKAKLQCFPGATSKQLLHYIYINLQGNNTESVILHVDINSVLQDSTETNTNCFLNNVKEIAKKCRSYNVKKSFISGIVYTERVNVKILEKVHALNSVYDTDAIGLLMLTTCLKIDYTWWNHGRISQQSTFFLN